MIIIPGSSLSFLGFFSRIKELRNYSLLETFNQRNSVILDEIIKIRDEKKKGMSERTGGH